MKFSMTGVIKAITSAKEPGRYYLRVQDADAKVQFTREGETPAPIQIILTDEKHVKGLGMGTVIDVTGRAAIGVHKWQPMKFNKPDGPAREIENYYFEADTVKVVPAQ